MDGALDESGLNANGLTPEEQATFDNLYGTNPGTAEAPKPGFFTRAWAGTGGIPSGLANTGLTIYDNANNLARSAVDKATYAWQDLTGAHDFSNLAGLPEGYGAGTPFHAREGTTAGDVRETVDTAAEHTQQDVAQWRENVNAFYRPDPETTGTAGNMLFGALEPITRIGVGSLLTGGKAGLEVAAGSMGYERAQELEAQGVDPFTAAKSGVVTAGTFEAMGAVGGEGGTLAQRVLKSAAVNTGAGLANRALDSAVLNAAGYNNLAQQQQWNDAQAIISDMVIGAAFPLVHAAGAKLVDASATRSEAKLADKITQSPELFDRLRMPDGNVSQFNIEAALTSLNAQHARDVAPGVPTDVRSQGLHIRALDAAIQQVLNGDAVNVEPIVRDMNTIPRPAPDGFEDQTAEALVADMYSDADLDAANFGQSEPPQTIPDDDAFWQSIPEGKNGRETFNIKGFERDALRQSLVEQHFEGIPEPQHAEGEQPIAYVMGGGGASGKGTILRLLMRKGDVPQSGLVEIDPDVIKTGGGAHNLTGIPEYAAMLARGDSRAANVVHEESSNIAMQVLARAISGKYDLVLDRTLGDKAKGLAELQALKDAGYRVKLYGVTLDPRLAVARAVTRAARSLRYVPLRHLLRAHKGFAGAFEDYARLVDEATLYDNGVNPGEAPVELAKGVGGRLQITDESAYNSFRGRSQINEQATTLRQLETAASAEPKLGRVAEAAPQGDGGSDRGAGPRGTGSGSAEWLQAGDRGTGEAEPSESITRAFDQQVEDSAAAIAAAYPDTPIPLDDGTTVTAADALRDADATITQAETDSRGLDAAAQCAAGFNYAE